MQDEALRQSAHFPGIGLDAPVRRQRKAIEFAGNGIFEGLRANLRCARNGVQLIGHRSGFAAVLGNDRNGDIKYPVANIGAGSADRVILGKGQSSGKSIRGGKNRIHGISLRIACGELLFVSFVQHNNRQFFRSNRKLAVHRQGKLFGCRGAGIIRDLEFNVVASLRPSGGNAG